MSVKKAASNGTVTYFIYDGSHVIMELDSSGNTVVTYTYGPRGLISQRRGATSYYAACDHLGSVWNVVTLDSNETISASYTYTAFGDTTTVGTDNTGNPYKYVGGIGYYNDAESGLMLLGARYYRPSIGRFISLDAVGDGWNLYWYADANPVTLVDPFGENGLCGALPIAGGAAVIDGPLPIGDVIGGIIIVVVGGYVLIDTWITWIHRKPKPRYIPNPKPPHEKGKRPSTGDEHTKPRPGDPEKGDWRRPNPPKKKSGDPRHRWGN